MENYNFKLAPAYCLYNGVVIERQNGASIKFLIENPQNDVLKGRLERAFSNYLDFVTQQKECPENYKRMKSVVYEVCSHKQLRKYVARLYEVSNENKLTEEDLQTKEKSEQNAAAVLLLDEILLRAREKGATDIHIEKDVIRFRVDGKLEKQMELQEKNILELVQRIKLLGGLNVLESSRSQDGHFVYGETNPMFVRVSSMPVLGKNYLNNCESIVLRLLDTSRIPLCIGELGFNQIQIEKIEDVKSLKNGLILICGPTGSGKSTTAGAILIEILKETNSKLKIISLEDPPEYVIPGVTQIQIDENKNKDFEHCLSHIFRQDPDVIMIGEIRNEETARTAIKASLTGHLVIATLHTSSVASSVLRMENLGIERKILASVIRAVISQELDFENGKGILLGDVAIPKEDFPEIVNQDLCEQDLENYFDHYINGQEVMKEIFALKKSRFAPLPYSKKNEIQSKEA